MNRQQRNENRKNASMLQCAAIVRRALRAHRPAGEVQVNVRTGSIGPSYDPYGYDEITAKLGDRLASWYSDGLGRVQMELWLAGKQVRVLEWFDPCTGFKNLPKHIRNTECLAEMLFRRWVGIGHRDAYEQYGESYCEDPMGPLSRYE